MNILIIKLGALGDFIGALGPMKSIRAHHPHDRLTLLTTKPFAELGRACGYFDDVLIDAKPKWHQPAAWLKLRRTLNAAHFQRVYDLQNNDRTALYLKLFSPQSEWVGVAPGASHRNTSPERTQGRAFDGHVQTLGLAGITNIIPDTLEWMKSNLSRFDLQSPYVLLVPGCSPQHPRKRWPPEQYRQAAERLIAQGYQIVLIGGPAEAQTNAEISDGINARNLTGKTDLYDIAALARGAAGAIGNDTGPSHIVSLTGCPTVVLYCNRASTIRKHGPLGLQTQAIEVDDLAALPAENVVKELRTLQDKDGR